MYMYHGTNKAAAENILKKGFEKYTYFTPYLSSAISMGGEYVFIIGDKNITDKDLGEGRWQWRYPEVILPERIIALIHYGGVQLLHYNSESEYQENKKEDDCPLCKGDGELTYPHDGHHLLPGGSAFTEREIVPCPECQKNRISKC